MHANEEDSSVKHTRLLSKPLPAKAEWVEIPYPNGEGEGETDPPMDWAGFWGAWVSTFEFLILITRLVGPKLPVAR